MPGRPQAGGSIVVPETWSSLDPGSSLFGLGTTEAAEPIFDTLFAPQSVFVPAKIRNAPPAPELALGATYSDNFKTLKITLRHGVTFQDGTPFNAAAVVFNFLRDKNNVDQSTVYMLAVTSVAAVGTYTVAIHFSAPNSNFLNTLEFEPVGEMYSPTALSSEGATQFGIMPVGAGPFKVVSDEVGVTLQLCAGPDTGMQSTYTSTGSRLRRRPLRLATRRSMRTSKLGASTNSRKVWAP